MVRRYQVLSLLLILQVKLKGVCAELLCQKSDSGIVSESLLSIAQEQAFFPEFQVGEISTALVTRILLSKDKRLLNCWLAFLSFCITEYSHSQILVI
jgi:hypothetical protein